MVEGEGDAEGVREGVDVTDAVGDPVSEGDPVGVLDPDRDRLEVLEPSK